MQNNADRSTSYTITYFNGVTDANAFEVDGTQALIVAYLPMIFQHGLTIQNFNEGGTNPPAATAQICSSGFIVSSADPNKCQ